MSSVIPVRRASNGQLPPTTAVERSRLRPTSWAMIAGAKYGQVAGCSRLNVIGDLPSFSDLGTGSRRVPPLVRRGDQRPDQVAPKAHGLAWRAHTSPR